MSLFRATLFAALAVALPFMAEAKAGERLMLVGGGETPAGAIARFCHWAGDRGARILVITWATSNPDEAFHDFSQELSACSPQQLEASPLASQIIRRKQEFLGRLGSYTAVFFTGGDQNRIMQVLADPEISRALRAMYRQGIPFGGTSAGTAIMSPLMITGEGDWTVIDGNAVETRPGLGLLEGTVLDTHFIRRRRENRLFSVIFSHPELLGVGIDEDTALFVTDGRLAEATGRGQVMMVDGEGARGSLRLELLGEGDRFDLSRRERLPRGPTQSP